MKFYRYGKDQEMLPCIELDDGTVLTVGEYVISAKKENPTYGTIVGGDVRRNNPLHVQRTYNGVTYDFWCYVTQDIKDAYDGGVLRIGDKVIIVFIDGDPNKPLATQKVYKTW